MINRKLSLLLYACLILLIGCQSCTKSLSEGIIVSGVNYTVFELSSEVPEYRYELYNNNTELVKSETVYRIAPTIDIVDEHIIFVRKNAGTNLYYEFYFDTLTNEFSPEYESPVILENGMVAYVVQTEENTSLIVCDMFHQEKYYKEVNLNLAPVANPRDALISVVLSNDDFIEITFLSGDDYKQEQKTISLY